jgi:hypothetical protein
MPSETKSNTTKISTKIINLSVQGVVVGAQQRERDSTGQLGSYRWGNKTVREREFCICTYRHINTGQKATPQEQAVPWACAFPLSTPQSENERLDQNVTFFESP